MLIRLMFLWFFLSIVSALGSLSTCLILSWLNPSDSISSLSPSIVFILSLSSQTSILPPGCIRAPTICWKESVRGELMLNLLGIAVPNFVNLASLSFFFLAFLPLRLSGWLMLGWEMTGLEYGLELAYGFIPE